ncbi:MAG: hypothetical protein J6R20_07000 [Clostridia bacterium]|nr:hypothetical protein [Clostridia bacterium]
MKKAITLFLAAAVILSSFSLASCGKNNSDETTTNAIDNAFLNYIGDGEKAMLSTLVQANAKLVTEVFTLSHLTVDQTKAITINGAKYAPVTDTSIFASYSVLEEMLLANYTKETVEKIIGNPPVYLEHEGVFYYNLDYDSGYNKSGKRYPLKWDTFEISVVKATDKSVDFLAILHDAHGVEVHFPMTAVIENGNFRLADFYVVN